MCNPPDDEARRNGLIASGFQAAAAFGLRGHVRPGPSTFVKGSPWPARAGLRIERRAGRTTRVCRWIEAHIARKAQNDGRWDRLDFTL